MARIKAGYWLHVVDGEGVLQGTLELGGYDLDRSLAASALALGICDILPAGAFEGDPDSESNTEEG